MNSFIRNLFTEKQTEGVVTKAHHRTSMYSQSITYKRMTESALTVTKSAKLTCAFAFYTLQTLLSSFDNTNPTIVFLM